ncbi:MAG TPA: TIGR01777 family oxidoreductase [Gemmatimonadales bacterium]
MRVFLTGGTGFLGRHLIATLAARGDSCVVLSRSAEALSIPGVELVQGDPRSGGAWMERVSGCDVVVNLAGQVILDPPRRWTARTKQALIASRVATTLQVVAAIRAAAQPPRLLVSGSAIGYYGAGHDQRLGERSPAGTDFLARLALAWEDAASGANDACRVALLRTGLVLGLDGGALARLLPLFRLGAGGPWGDGQQWWSWIHVADWVGVVRWIIERELTGPVNVVAPEPVTVNEFAARLGSALHRPAVIRAPAFALRLLLGEAASALLDLQRAVPTRALETGYRFLFPTINSALTDLLR